MMLLVDDIVQASLAAPFFRVASRLCGSCNVVMASGVPLRATEEVR